MTNNNTQKQASEFDNFAYNIAPQFEDGFYGYAVDKDFSMSIVQMYLDCETEEDEKKVDRALRKLRNFHLSMDRGHLKNKAKYSGEEMFKESNFKEYVKRQNEKYPPKEEDMKTEKEPKANVEETRPTRMTKTENVVTEEEHAKKEKEMNEKAQEVAANNTDNDVDNNTDNELITTIEQPTSISIAAEEVQKADNRTYEEKVEGMKNFYDASDPDGKRAELLIQKAEEILGTDEYAIMCNAYNKPETYQRLCNLWDYFHRNRPGDWPERPNFS